MKQTITTLLTVLLCKALLGQQFITGSYNDGLRLAFDNTSKKVTGYFEERAGSSEQKGGPHFSCIFYLEGTMTGQPFTVMTYYPTDKKSDLVQGTLEIVTSKKVTIKLTKEHGGCWNVQPFAREAVVFTLDVGYPWIQIRYLDAAKSYFYSDKREDKSLNSYIVRGNIFCIEKIEDQWAYGNLAGKKSAKGWLKLTDLNKL